VFDRLVPGAVVRENERQVDRLVGDIEVEIPVFARKVSDFMGARWRVDKPLLLVRNLWTRMSVGGGDNGEQRYHRVIGGGH
jgi:hypothetical protein